jgi:hypothetical protein
LKNEVDRILDKDGQVVRIKEEKKLEKQYTQGDLVGDFN